MKNFEERVPAHVGYKQKQSCPKKNTKRLIFFGAFLHRWAFRPNSELTAIFNFHLTRMKESALIPKIMHEWLTGGAPVDLGHRIFVEDASPLVRLFSTRKKINSYSTYVKICSYFIQFT